MVLFYLGMHDDVLDECLVLLTYQYIVHGPAVSDLRPLIYVCDRAFPTSWRANKCVGGYHFIFRTAFQQTSTAVIPGVSSIVFYARFPCPADDVGARSLFTTLCHPCGGCSTTVSYIPLWPNCFTGVDRTTISALLIS